MPCFLSCRSRSVLAKPLEHQCSSATTSPSCGTNSLRISPPHVPYLEDLPRPSGLLNGRNVLPSLVVARTVASMERIEHAQLRVPRRTEDRGHVRNAVIGFCHTLQALPDLAALGDEIVIGVDHQ